MFKPFLCCLLLISAAAFSQQKKMEVDSHIPRNETASYKTYSFVNRERNRVCILAVSRLNIKGYILDENYVLMHEFEKEKPEGMQEFRGGFFDNEKVHFLLNVTGGDHNLDHYIYDATNGIISSNQVKLDAQKSKFVGSLSLGDKFLIFTARNDDKMVVYEFGKEIIHQVWEMNYPGSSTGYRSLTDAFSNYAGYIRDWDLPSLFDATDVRKMYYRNDTVFITIDKEIGRIDVFQIDLQRKNITCRTLPRITAECDDEFRSASALSGRNLYSVVACHSGIKLVVYDFYSGKNITQYSANRNDEITFRNTDIIEGGTDLSGKGTKKLEKTEKLLDLMIKGRPFIIGKNTNNGNTQLIIGGYREQMISTGGAGVQGFSKVIITTAGFMTLLDENTGEKVNGELEKSIDEKMQDITKDAKIPDGCDGVYPVHKNSAYYYLDKKKQKLVIVAL